MDPNDTKLDWSAVARALAGVSEDMSSEGSSPMSYVSNDHDGLTDNELLAHSDSDSDREDQKSGRTRCTSPRGVCEYQKAPSAPLTGFPLTILRMTHPQPRPDSAE
jgi:hypothetical protein